MNSSGGCGVWSASATAKADTTQTAPYRRSWAPPIIRTARPGEKSLASLRRVNWWTSLAADSSVQKNKTIYHKLLNNKNGHYPNKKATLKSAKQVLCKLNTSSRYKFLTLNWIYYIYSLEVVWVVFCICPTQR